MKSRRRHLTSLACLTLFVMAGASCGSVEPQDDVTASETVPSVEVVQSEPEATAVPTETPDSIDSEASEPVAAEPKSIPLDTESSPPKLTLAPISVAPGDSLCVAEGVNYLDRLELSFEFIGSDEVTQVSVDYRVTAEGVLIEDTSHLGLINKGEQVRILDNTSHRVDEFLDVDGVVCEVLGVTQTPTEDDLPVVATCEAGNLDPNGRLDVVITVDTSEAASLAEDLPLIMYWLGLYDANGVRVATTVPSAVLPADGSEAQLHRRTFVRAGGPVDLADYDLSCDAFSFRVKETLVAADPGSTCVIEGVDGFNDMVGSVVSPIEDSFDMWLAVAGPDGTWVATPEVFVFPEDMSFVTIIQVPDGLSAADLSCQVIGIEQ